MALTSKANGDGRLLLMGCGAVGGVVAGGLLRAGQDLTLVTHNEEIAATINCMNGYVVDKGQEKGVPTPVNASLTAMVRDIEAGVRTIRPDNLEDLLQSISLAP